MPAQELSAHPILGHRGPTQDGLLYKKSDRGEFRPRYFELKDRRLSFWADGDTIDLVDGHLRPKGQVGAEQHDRITATTPKGYRDIVGATIRTIEQCCDGPNGPRTNWFGVEIIEEYGVARGTDPAIAKECAKRGKDWLAGTSFRPSQQPTPFRRSFAAKTRNYLAADTRQERPPDRRRFRRLLTTVQARGHNTALPLRSGGAGYVGGCSQPGEAGHVGARQRPTRGA